jgi:hypothetical protein
VEDLAKKHLEVFVAGAVALGLLGLRLLRGASHESDERKDEKKLECGSGGSLGREQRRRTMPRLATARIRVVGQVVGSAQSTPGVDR